MKLRIFLAISFFCLLITACSRQAGPEITWSQLIEDVYRPESIADLSLPRADIYTSYDRFGGNNDYNAGFVKADDGWLLLADVKGPGYLSRFWFTGIDPKSRFRFMFDGEKTPRKEISCRDLYNGECGFPSGLISTDQNCFYSEFPVPFRKRLRILVTDDGYSRNKGKLFFQINTVKLKGKKVSSAQFPVPADVSSVANSVLKNRTAAEPDGSIRQQHFEVGPNSAQPVVLFNSGGIIRKLRIEPNGWADATFEQRTELLRQIWIRIAWDGSDKNSVSVPFGDFFGQMWEPKKIDMLYFSSDETGFECRIPMPFRKSADIAFENTGSNSVAGQILILKDDGAVPDSYGYFHSGWNRSSQNQQGRPHEVLNADGRGRLAGCLLGAASYDRSFWFLESDETVTTDHGKKLFWQGTGLEDYFNCGWYYRTVFEKPLFGLLLKRPFRTVQYRFHLADAVTFKDGLKMSFERGPGNTSHVAYDSTVYYYLDHPAEAFGTRPGSGPSSFPADEFESRSLMTRLWDYERLGDFSNAEKLTQYAVNAWNYPPGIKNLLKLRLLEYQARRNGYDSVRDQFHQIQAAGGSAGAEAGKLIEFHEKGFALAFAYSNRKTTLLLDGAPVLTAGDPVRFAVAAVPVSSGSHVLSVKTEVGGWPDWVLAGLAKGSEVIGTDLTWSSASTESSSSGGAVLAKGPPEMEAVPFVYPDPYVGLQSTAEGLRYAEAQNFDEGPVLQKAVQFY